MAPADNARVAYSREKIMVWCRFALIALVVVLAGQSTAGYAATEQKPGNILAHPEISGVLKAIDAWIEGVRIYDDVPGISAGIVLDQELIWSHGYGYSNLESKRPADANTLYSICSISKLFTSIGIMQLRDAERLRLRDSVGQHLDWFDIKQAHERSGPITIESLLTHSSGLPRESDFPYWDGPDFPFPEREKMIEALSTQQTLYPAQRIFQARRARPGTLGPAWSRARSCRGRARDCGTARQRRRVGRARAR